jgi:hypothetical protein
VSFAADLGELRRESGGPEGEVLLDVLYYPGLQEVDVRVDGKPAGVSLGTFWQRRAEIPQIFSPEPGAFHGLRISGAPARGALDVRVRFTGWRWANWTSLLSAVLLAAGAAAEGFRRRRGARKPVGQIGALAAVPGEASATGPGAGPTAPGGTGGAA